MFPCMVRFLEEMLSKDFPRRLTYAQHFFRKLGTDYGYQDRILISDRCNCHHNEVANKYNERAYVEKIFVCALKYLTSHCMLQNDAVCI